MKIVWNMKGFRDLRTDPAMMALVESEAAAIAERAGAGFEYDKVKATGGRVRAHSQVRTATPEAIAANAKSNVLLKALGGTGMVTYTSKAGKTSLITQAQAANYTRMKKGPK